jgi:hypothetical protein
VTVTGGGGGDQGVTVSVGSGPCTPTNPTEICDGIDNDCNGQIDEGLDFADPRQCGSCANNCYTTLLNADPESITCTDGVCDGTCAADYFDRDGDGTCETYCVTTTDDDAICNNKDDNCNGQVDENVDKCADPDNCGACGRQCNVANADPHCVSEAEEDEACEDSNTQCVILPGDCDEGFIDKDGLYSNGCEYPCEATGPEICGDGIDNDCDGAVDGLDSDLSGDPFVGEDCFGGQAPGGPPPNGVCAAEGNEGQWACVGLEYRCEGPNVVEPGDLQEMCNGEDDDCDGLTDDSPSDVGAACGASNNAPCRLGEQQCLSGTLTCVGAINPGTELCNGIDDDCDGDIDLANNLPPADAIGPCNVPPPAPPGGTSACMAGTLRCVAGTIDCNGDVGPQGASDTCGVDQNCDGLLGNQPDRQTDVRNCGSCGNDCYEGAVNSIWACVTGTCQFQGCQAGFADPNGDQLCELACTPTGPEVCDGNDNDCDGQIDEGVALPPVSQVCGVSPSATRPECTSGVTVACTNGQIRCTFPANVCGNGDGTPGCSAGDERCDGLDNDCDGYLDENVPNVGKACASDDGDPPPGDGACRRPGTIVCTSPTTAECNAETADCADNPGGCTERCDGIDNDCDGSVDESFSDPGSDVAFFYKPEVVRIRTAANNNRWIHAYEASRPSATASTPGSGNGYVDTAPQGQTRDATPACSESGKIPWFNVTPDEVEQTCEMMGGFVCDYDTDWYRACSVEPRTPDCTWGYNPSTTAACTTSDTTTKYCNIASAFDFDGGIAGDQDGLLPTGNLGGQSGGTNRDCFADWNGLLGNPNSDDAVYDITGNLREIVLDGAQFRVVGGAFNTQAESGATCAFDFYAVPDDFKFFDTGFRCCFDENPSPP